MKYLIEKKENEVKFKEVTLNTEEYGDSLVELTDGELDQKLVEYSKQGLYVSTYYQYQTMRHGIEFRRFPPVIHLMTFTEDKKYNWKPKNMPDDEPLSGEECYFIKPNLANVEVSLLPLGAMYPYPERYTHYLTQTEFADIVREYLKQGLPVHYGRYERRKKKYEFISHCMVQKVTDDGEVVYYKQDLK